MYQNYPGGLFCCDAGAHHMGSSQFEFDAAPAGLPTRRYRLKLTVGYIPLNVPASDVGFGLRVDSPGSWQHRFVNVQGGTFMTSAPHSEYAVPVCAPGDDDCNAVHVKSSTWSYVTSARSAHIECTDCPRATSHMLATPGAASGSTTLRMPLPMSGRVGIAWAGGHQHVGGRGVELWLQRPGSTGASEEQLLCRSTPVYGTKVGVPGNEQGYIAGTVPCRFQGQGPTEVPAVSTSSHGCCTSHSAAAGVVFVPVCGCTPSHLSYSKVDPLRRRRGPL
eukprot:SAG11_NODE_232_length_11930_cov_6.884794_3_plen_277_part_00